MGKQRGESGASRYWLLPLKALGSTVWQMSRPFFWIVAVIVASPVRLTKLPPYLIVLLLILGQFFVAVLNPFDLENSMDKNVAQVSSAIVSPFYGGGKRVAQDHISVVLINQDNLRNFNTPGWPPPYEVQSAILQRVASHSPKAIFLDFHYSDPQRDPALPVEFDPLGVKRMSRLMSGPADDSNSGKYEHVERFAEKLQSLSEGNGGVSGIPIYLGPVSSGKGLERLAELKTSRYGESGQVGVSVSVDKSIVYPAFDKDHRRQSAYALWQDFCDIWPESNCHGRQMAINSEDSLVVNWGFGAQNRLHAHELARIANAAEQRNSSPQLLVSAGCSASDLRERIKKAIELFWRSASYGISRSSRGPITEKCTYHDFITADMLFSGLTDEQLAVFLKDKIVMVGADVNYLSDMVDTPIYKKLPGVMVHAMALDNLVESKGRTIKNPRQLFGGLDASDLFVTLLLLLISVVLFVTRAGISRKELQGNSEEVDVGRMGRGDRIARYAAVIVVLTGLAILFSVFVMRWPIVNLIEILAASLSVVGILEFLLRPDESR